MSRTVIITDTQYRAAAAVARELGRAGFRVLAAYSESGVPVSARSRYVSERIKLDADSYADSLLALAEREDAVIFPAGARTTEIMAARHADFSRFSLFPDAETLRRANDKRRVAASARSIEIRAPREYDLSDLGKDLTYPAVVKYVNGEGLGLSAEKRYAVARNRAELDAAINKMVPHPCFVSEYIAGAGYGVSVLMDKNHRAVRVFCHERLREYPLTGGPSVKCRAVWNENMARDAVKLLRALNFEGIAMVEFKGTPEDYALLEINPRVWGSYPLSYLAGAGFARAFVRAALGEALPEPSSAEYNTGTKMQYFISGARWAAASARESKNPAPFLRYAADVLDPRVKHGLWSLRDPLPGICYLLKMARCGAEPLRRRWRHLPSQGHASSSVGGGVHTAPSFPDASSPNSGRVWTPAPTAGRQGEAPPKAAEGFPPRVPRRGEPMCSPWYVRIGSFVRLHLPGRTRRSAPTVGTGEEPHLRLDLHTHSNYSHDGVSAPREIIAAALALGLDGVAICDHNIFRAYEEAKVLAPEGFIVIPGVEYSTDCGHVLALFVSGMYDVRYSERGVCSLSELRAAADADGAILIAAHPFRHRDTALPELFELTDGVETLNSRDDAREPQNEAKAITAAEKHGKFITGGSDAHIPREIGACYTILPDGLERAPEAVRAALLSGLTTAGGPGGRLIDQATAKLRRTSIKRLPKDLARLVYFILKGILRKWH
ncbi:MAG: ATP-grasp domain-containing protein [Oscillospiraceae bacterium]|jgi:predicted metal-dependent phosphoesterase TrpH/predicted ATP-grasp superfamily ATP-dependent carboligase|nr:ATP-grasp domain-containing protein [Oscillospiraceae bacterium]